MRASITLALLLGATLSVSALGCRDAGPSGPERALDNRSGSGDGSEATSGPGNGGAASDSTSGTEQPENTTETADPAHPDTAVQEPLPLPASFTLRGLARGAVSTSDTTLTVPLAGVTANLYRVKTADGAALQPEVLAGSAVTGANGDFTFRDVASAHYRLEVKAPGGGPYADASRAIAPPSSSSIHVYVVLLQRR